MSWTRSSFPVVSVNAAILLSVAWALDVIMLHAASASFFASASKYFLANCSAVSDESLEHPNMPDKMHNRIKLFADVMVFINREAILSTRGDKLFA